MYKCEHCRKEYKRRLPTRFCQECLDCGLLEYTDENTEPNKELRELAIKIYLLKPFWKKRSFIKWNKSNGWDIKHVFDECVEEAKLLLGAYITKI